MKFADKVKVLDLLGFKSGMPNEFHQFDKKTRGYHQDIFRLAAFTRNFFQKSNTFMFFTFFYTFSLSLTFSIFFIQK